MASRNAKGRMIYWKISYSKQVSRVSLLAQLLFTWLIPNVDDLGRMEGDPEIIKGMIFPYHNKITIFNVEAALQELSKEQLIVWYQVDENKYILLPNFAIYQKLRNDREYTSDYPDPPEQFCNIDVTCRDKSRHVGQNMREVKRREEKRSEGEDEVKGNIRAREPQPEKVQFAENVSMTNAEYEKLVSTHGSANTKQMVEKLDNYKGATGKTYKSDYRAILSWVVDEIIKKQNPKVQGKASFADLAKEMVSGE